MTDIFCVTGAGGVGKTTLSAALAVRLARQGRKTVVITVDPARRLGQALGISELGHEAHQTSEPNLWAAMLDAQGSWEDIARIHASPEAASRLLGNPFFQAVARRFPASQSYAASDTMTKEVESGRWDVVVVDTPPSSGGIEFFTAADALVELIDGPLLRALTGAGFPGVASALRFAATPVLKIADAILGSAVLEDLTAFLFDLRTTSEGLHRRSEEIGAMFRRTRNIIVTTADPGPLAEAEQFVDLLPGVASAPEMLLFNRAVPPEWAAHAATHPSGPASRNLALWAAEAVRQESLRDRLSTELSLPVQTIAWRSAAPTSVDAVSGLLEGIHFAA